MKTLYLILLISGSVLSTANFLVILGDLIRKHSYVISVISIILLLSAMVLKCLCYNIISEAY
jgi:hypothetical protein